MSGQAARSKAADRQRGAVDRKRLDDRVYARTVGQARVDHRNRLVQAPSKRCDNPFDHQPQLLFAGELFRGAIDLAEALDVHGLGNVDHDFGDGRVGHQIFERPESERFVDDLVLELRDLFGRQIFVLVFAEDLLRDVVDLRTQLGELGGVAVRLACLDEVDFLSERFMNIGLDAVARRDQHRILRLSPVARSLARFGSCGTRAHRGARFAAPILNEAARGG